MSPTTAQKSGPDDSRTANWRKLTGPEAKRSSASVTASWEIQSMLRPRRGEGNEKNPDTNEWRTLAESYIAKMTDEEIREYAIKAMQRDIMLIIKAIKTLWEGAKNGKEE